MNNEPSCAELQAEIELLRDNAIRMADDAVSLIDGCESKYQAILDTVDSQLTIIDRNYKITWANRKARELFGENIVGRSCRRACQGSDGPCAQGKCIVREAFRSGVVQSHETEMFDRSGRKRHFSGSAHVIRRNEKGEATAVVKAYQDISVRKRAEQKLQESMRQLRDNLAGTIQAMAMTVETRDPYTGGHQRRTADIARGIAQQMKLSGREIDGIRMAGVMHDLGKISIPAEILSRPGRLGDSEFALIKRHPRTGYDILKGIDFKWPVAEIVRQHHERFDGTGYPFGLKGDNIRIEARIIGVADVLEAMSSHRPYRPSLGVGTAIDEVTRQSGVLYDPDVVNAAMQLHARNELPMQ